MKQKIKAGDQVVVLAGNARGERGKVIQVLPKKERIIVEGVNVRRFRAQRSEQNPDGGFEEREAPIHLSNVMKADRYDARPKTKGPAEEPAETTEG